MPTSKIAHRRAQLGDLGRHLHLEAEAVALQRRNAIQHAGAEDLVAHLDVGEVQVREHVAHERDDLVAQRVPEVEHAVRPAADEARAEHDVGAAADDGLEQADIIVGVVLEVRVLHEDDVARGPREPVAQGRSLPWLYSLWTTWNDTPGNSAGSSSSLAAVPSVEWSFTQTISRVMPAGSRASTTRRTSVWNRRLLVVDRDDDGQLERGGAGRCGSGCVGHGNWRGILRMTREVATALSLSPVLAGVGAVG